MQAGFYSANVRFQSGSNNTSEGKWSTYMAPFSARQANVIHSHPIPKLMEEAESAFRKKVAKQSQTLAAAVSEYKRRYKRPPPKGFDAWWAFAQKHDVMLVDEYDGLVEDLAPFWDLSGQEFRRRADQVCKSDFSSTLLLKSHRLRCYLPLTWSEYETEYRLL